MRTPAARFNRLYALHNAAHRAQDEEFFRGFTFNGRTSLAALSGFYGLNVPVSEPGITLAEYLTRTCDGGELAGHRVNLGRAELVVREVREGTVKKAGLRFLPIVPRQLRSHRPRGRTHDARRIVEFGKRSAISGER
jgi:NhaP-type Na+/H+ and K+/H+ antiporter